MVTIVWNRSVQNKGRILLQSTLGQDIRKIGIAPQSRMQEISLAGLPAGLYWVQVRDAKGIVGTGKVVKE